MRVPTGRASAASGSGAGADVSGSGGGARWRVRRDLIVAKAAGAALFAVLALWSVLARGEAAGAFLAGAAAALFAVLTLRDLLAPVRLAADAGGLTVVDGFAAVRRLGWSEVERVEVREHTRYGLRWRLLEIETRDDLYQFAAHELSADCADVAAELAALRPSPGGRHQAARDDGGDGGRSVRA
jgi:Protein of unknown function (DUF2581).